MPKSKHRKKHQERLSQYKANKKKEQELFKKKMIDNYMKMQQEMMASQEAHTSTEEVSGPEINLDELNKVDVNLEDIQPVNLEESIIETPELVENDNNNQ